MKKQLIFILVLLAILGFCRKERKDYCNKVNVFIGTDGAGHTYHTPMYSFLIAKDQKSFPVHTEANGKNIVAVINFKTTHQNPPVLVKTGISAVSTEGARENLLGEIPDWNFEQARKKAKKT